ncbi:methyltransferase domain-containing protein [Streptomyces sp. NPDC004546]|uniref:class I SAM-dependent methyltransferase n=1 Tax=Streptomyces sp. NPDC004546 TaxID=3154282 RepID=UPI0033AC7DE9
MSRWKELTGGTSGQDYAARFAALARSGKDMHGEARFCASLVPAGARVLDAGCDTGRVMIRLARLGYECVGVDLDASMLAVARKQAPELPWFQADLAEFAPDALGVAADFDLDEAHLPVPPSITLPEYDDCCAAAGLTLVDRSATWDADPYDGGGYAVSVHGR